MSSARCFRLRSLTAVTGSRGPLFEERILRFIYSDTIHRSPLVRTSRIRQFAPTILGTYYVSVFRMMESQTDVRNLALVALVPSPLGAEFLTDSNDLCQEQFDSHFDPSMRAETSQYSNILSLQTEQPARLRLS